MHSAYTAKITSHTPSASLKMYFHKQVSITAISKVISGLTIQSTAPDYQTMEFLEPFSAHSASLWTIDPSHPLPVFRCQLNSGPKRDKTWATYPARDC